MAMYEVEGRHVHLGFRQETFWPCQTIRKATSRLGQKYFHNRVFIFISFMTFRAKTTLNIYCQFNHNLTSESINRLIFWDRTSHLCHKTWREKSRNFFHISLRFLLQANLVLKVAFKMDITRRSNVIILSLLAMMLNIFLMFHAQI